jgi:ADP-ribose pyrophosphatase YjhB (NUDIX family)
MPVTLLIFFIMQGSTLMEYCPRCGQALEEREAFGRLRPVCPGCGHVVFRGPKLAAGALVVRAGTILLNQRDIDPGIGKWGLPAGFVDLGERVEDAAIREVKEETGLDICLEDVLGVYSDVERGVALVIYCARECGGELIVGHETRAVGFFAPDALPELAFAQNQTIIDDWLRRKDH